LIITSEHPSAGPIKLAGFPYKLLSTPPLLQLPPPRLGEHTDEILVELLGYEEADIASLRAGEVI
jgi:crotonobetainyl-CoA:carnitine CoA-transferase CaiB-like acyl-CoA transferase